MAPNGVKFTDMFTHERSCIGGKPKSPGPDGKFGYGGHCPQDTKKHSYTIQTLQKEINYT